MILITNPHHDPFGLCSTKNNLYHPTPTLHHTPTSHPLFLSLLSDQEGWALQEKPQRFGVNRLIVITAKVRKRIAVAVFTHRSEKRKQVQ